MRLSACARGRGGSWVWALVAIALIAVVVWRVAAVAGGPSDRDKVAAFRRMRAAPVCADRRADEFSVSEEFPSGGSHPRVQAAWKPYLHDQAAAYRDFAADIVDYDWSGPEAERAADASEEYLRRAELLEAKADAPSETRYYALQDSFIDRERDFAQRMRREYYIGADQEPSDPTAGLRVLLGLGGDTYEDVHC